MLLAFGTLLGLYPDLLLRYPPERKGLELAVSLLLDVASILVLSVAAAPKKVLTGHLSKYASPSKAKGEGSSRWNKSKYPGFLDFNQPGKKFHLEIVPSYAN
jgi:hypothetical protein